MPRLLRLRNATFDLKALRKLPSRPGAAQRLAAIPVWDGSMRFKQDNFEHDWTSEELNDAAREGLYSMAAGQCGYTKRDCLARERDPNDPEAVRRQILQDYRNAGEQY